MSARDRSRLLRRVVRVEPGEVASMLWSAAYIFCLMCGYYVLRSVRDEIGSEHADKLPEVWTSVFFVMLVLVPLYSAITARWPRRVFIPLANRFFNVQLVILFVLLHTLEGEARAWAEWVFYVWNSAFVMFVLSVFWGFMADVFKSDQGKRLFGFIAFGGSLGGILGPIITTLLVESVGQVNLFLVPIVLLELACLCVRRLNDLSASGGPGPGQEDERQPIRGSILHGIQVVFRNPYLLGIAVFLFLYTYGSTMIYFEKAEIARDAFENRDLRTAFYAQVDLVVNLLALLAQLFLTGRILPRLGVARSLMVIPLVTLLGFAALGTFPTLWVLVVFEVTRRFGEYALGKPTREVLFTVVSREEKYKSKVFIDTVVYRGSDMVNGYIHDGLSTGLGLGLSAVAYVAVPMAGLWMLVAGLLGRRQDALARLQGAAAGDRSPEGALPRQG